MALSGTAAFAEPHQDPADSATRRFIAAAHPSQTALGESTGNTATASASETQQKLDKMVTNCNHMMESMRMNSMRSSPNGSTGQNN